MAIKLINLHCISVPIHTMKMMTTVETSRLPNFNTGYLGNYQLLGDSQFVRFCVQILGLESTFDDKHRAQVGFCISGQDSTELAELVAENYKYLHDNLIIMIGTNDVKNKVHKYSFEKAIDSLKSTLEWKTVIWLTIPPIPKYHDSETHVKKLNHFNEEIRNLHGDNIQVLDAYSLFMDRNNSPKTYCFEEYYQSRMQIKRANDLNINLKPSNRRDDIHLNRRGLIRLCTWLCFNLLPQKLDVLQHYRERNPSQKIRTNIYQEFLYLSTLLTNSGITREELYSYIMGSQNG